MEPVLISKQKIENSRLRKLQLHLSLMLSEFDEYCMAHDVKYTLEGGTALGAYRHRGFIPWDDDIDVRMDIAEYRKFCKAMSLDAPRYLRLQNHQTDSLYMNGYAKLRDTRTVFKEQRVNTEYAENGCFIDIFPYEKAFPVLIAIYHWLHKPLFNLCSYPLHKHPITHKVACAYFTICQGVASIFRFISKVFGCKIYSYTYGSNIYTFKYRYKEDIFKNTRFLQFEGKEYPVPGKTEEYLTILYGENYMELPPEDQRVSHHVDEIIGV